MLNGTIQKPEYEVQVRMLKHLVPINIFMNQYT